MLNQYAWNLGDVEEKKAEKNATQLSLTGYDFFFKAVCLYFEAVLKLWQPWKFIGSHNSLEANAVFLRFWFVY
jgi:hypothetical protein